MLTRERIAGLAALARIDHRTARALETVVSAVSAAPDLAGGLAHVASRLATEGATTAALAALDALELDSRLGSQAPLGYLLIALLELPAAEERHRALGVPALVSRATWADLSVWCHHLRKRDGQLGLTRESLEWAQQALGGHLLRFGHLQFEVQGFTGPLRAFRHRRTGQLRALALPGSHFSHQRRFVAQQPGPNTWTAGGSDTTGHLIPYENGQVSEELTELDALTWESALTPGEPMLRMHIPADARLSLPDFFSSAVAAFAFFASASKKGPLKGIFGEAWLLDPAVVPFLPDPSRAADLARMAHLYPGCIPEAKTVRRLFGYTATRQTIVSSPREGMNRLQRALADFLLAPENALCARGAFMLMRELEPHLRASKQGASP